MVETVCYVSDVNMAISMFGKFNHEDNCGYFSKCTNLIHKYDGELHLDVAYCEFDMSIVLPLLILLIVAAYMIKRRFFPSAYSSNDHHFPSSSSSSHGFRRH